MCPIKSGAEKTGSGGHADVRNPELMSQAEYEALRKKGGEDKIVPLSTDVDYGIMPCELALLRGSQEGQKEPLPT